MGASLNQFCRVHWRERGYKGTLEPVVDECSHILGDSEGENAQGYPGSVSHVARAAWCLLDDIVVGGEPSFRNHRIQIILNICEMYSTLR